MNRRDFLKLIVSIPVLGALALFVSPLFRFLRPSSGPLSDTKIDISDPNPLNWQGNGGLFSTPDMPTREREVVFPLSAFPAPWSYQTFTFSQRSKEYTFRRFQTTSIPGFVVRLPENQSNGQPDFSVVSRICPHMGCVFNFVPAAELAAYNYPIGRNPMYACPCHLSVYDPLQTQPIETGEQVRGRVVSGPAPRPPRVFQWQIDGDRLLITEAEAGGIS